MDMTNGGLYASIMQQYGTKEEAGAFVLMSLESGPLMTMIILGTAGIASFEPHVFVGAVLPFLVGFALGNLDPELREFFSKAVQTLIPFFAFALGNTIDLTVIAQTGLLGILLGVAVIIVTGIPLIIADKLIGGGDGTAGIAASSSAGAAVATPVLIAEMVPAFKPTVEARLWLSTMLERSLTRPRQSNQEQEIISHYRLTANYRNMYIICSRRRSRELFCLSLQVLTAQEMTVRIL